LDTHCMNFYYFIVNSGMVKLLAGLFSLLLSYVMILYQDLISVSSSLDNGPVVIEKVNSFKQTSELDSPDRYFHKPY
jgi:hypothetical protein